MTDVGVAVTDLRVVCKIITCVSAFTFIVKTAAKLLLLQVWTLYIAGYTRRMPLRALTITQDYLACWTRTRHDFSLTCHSLHRARQPLSRLAWVASRRQGTSCSSSFVSKVLGANYSNFHPVANKFAIALTGSNL